MIKLVPKTIYSSPEIFIRLPSRTCQAQTFKNPRTPRKGLSVLSRDHHPETSFSRHRSPVPLYPVARTCVYRRLVASYKKQAVRLSLRTTVPFPGQPRLAPSPRPPAWQATCAYVPGFYWRPERGCREQQRAGLQGFKTYIRARKTRNRAALSQMLPRRRWQRFTRVGFCARRI